ncbi:7028_t:CDS:2 [Entrophospora sp. SA101]|nr:1376_t:CDS:2 [Entrophospora sp. SA101]CAJ0768047.1 7028_t:CDS:2 [Entrophospora sp. SA101]
MNNNNNNNNNINNNNYNSLAFLMHQPIYGINIDQKYTFEQPLNEAKQHCKAKLHKHKKSYMFVLEYPNNGNLCEHLKSNLIQWEKHETIIKTPRKYAEIYIGNNKKNYITISYDLFNGQSQHTDKESQISFLHIHQVMQDLDNITNTIEDVDNLIDQTNNEPQGDGLLNSTEPSFSMQANDI